MSLHCTQCILWGYTQSVGQCSQKVCHWESYVAHVQYNWTLQNLSQVVRWDAIKHWEHVEKPVCCLWDCCHIRGVLSLSSHLTQRKKRRTSCYWLNRAFFLIPLKHSGPHSPYLWVWGICLPSTIWCSSKYTVMGVWTPVADHHNSNNPWFGNKNIRFKTAVCFLFPHLTRKFHAGIVLNMELHTNQSDFIFIC